MARADAQTRTRTVLGSLCCCVSACVATTLLLSALGAFQLAKAVPSSALFDPASPPLDAAAAWAPLVALAIFWTLVLSVMCCCGLACCCMSGDRGADADALREREKEQSPVLRELVAHVSGAQP
jgi:hypothetical protein